ncbi:MAG: hypothetical protein A2Z20_05520 [Bdellovibrionales bacterium RBG_16_40_8]|nr:MAG: hypothetical protein A2Z20_05520 [Bdellovibrionales bacterium RBG_16_40_8]
MEPLFIFLGAFAAFAISSRGLISAFKENVTLLSYTAGYSLRALRIARAYKIMAWLLLTLFLFITSISAFLDVFYMM